MKKLDNESKAAVLGAFVLSYMIITTLAGYEQLWTIPMYCITLFAILSLVISLIKDVTLAKWRTKRYEYWSEYKAHKEKP